MKYHAEDTSTDNGPRWSNRFRTGITPFLHSVTELSIISGFT